MVWLTGWISGVTNAVADSSFHYSNLTVTQYDRPEVLVCATVTNVGTVDAHEVAQLYVSVPGAGQHLKDHKDPRALASPGPPVGPGSGAPPLLPIPIRSLQGFERVFLQVGAAAVLEFRLTPRQFATVQESGDAVVTAGKYSVSVGGHQPGDPNALDNLLRGEFEVATAQRLSGSAL